jgi:endoglycosylceramidase
MNFLLSARAAHVFCTGIALSLSACSSKQQDARHERDAAPIQASDAASESDAQVARDAAPIGHDAARDAAVHDAGAGAGQLSLLPIHSKNGQLQDSLNRTVVLRGVNLRADGFFDGFHKHRPLPPVSAEDCRIIGEDLGMNTVRLAINWSLLEPTRGQLDQNYIDKISKLIGDCAGHGVYTLVDLHQDGWSKYVGEDGAPFWAHRPALAPEAMDERNGGNATTSVPVQLAFGAFFSDHAGLVMDYASMAARVAQIIEHVPGVIGLELINEPMVLAPGDLESFYGAVAPAVRTAAPTLPIYFEPDAVRNVVDLANPSALGVDDTVYAPHLYTGVFQGDWKVGQDSRIEDSVGRMLNEAKTTKGALVITEFGHHPAQDVGAAWLTAAFHSLDQHALSALFWVYEEWPSTCGGASCWGLYDEAPDGNADGGTPASFTRTLRPAAVTLVGRAYPAAIAGRLDSFTYDPASRTLNVQLSGAPGTQVLSAPTLVYTQEPHVTCDGAPVSVARRGSRVEVSCAGKELVMRP